MPNKILVSLFFIFIYSHIAYAQLSPGDLSSPHSSLEGLENCDKCHDSQKRISAEKCLKCHQALNERIQAGLGLHAHVDYQKCDSCHVEHQGREYKLIYWNGGQSNFEHAQTGYRLQGKHLGVECLKCHSPEHITDKQKLESEKIDLNKTFLGIKKDCLNCHRDEHRGQLLADCISCHNMNGWKPAPQFDHSKSKYPLVGKHAQVVCEKCHKMEIDNKYPDDFGYVKYSNIAYGNCTDCHLDAHNGKLSQSCQNCHSSESWQQVNRAQFDHSKTSYPLNGKHLTVSCEKCHRPGQPLKGLKFAQCTDCHQDYHAEQFAARLKKGACEECHTVAGYIPANFTIAQHDSTKYRLMGSHLAVACNLCHPKIDTAGATTTRFKFESTQCIICHKDPHRGELDKYTKDKGCEFCHSPAAWAKVEFDHSRTKFPLEGHHKDVICGKCHPVIDTGKPTQHLQFVNLTQSCVDCHKDIHRGQFAKSNDSENRQATPIDCGKCHTPNSWHAEKFDHNRSASFKLEGAHQKLPCQSCHKQVGQIGQTFTLYKPIDSSCKSCHGAKQMQEGG